MTFAERHRLQADPPLADLLLVVRLARCLPLLEVVGQLVEEDPVDHLVAHQGNPLQPARPGSQDAVQEQVDGGRAPLARPDVDPVGASEADAFFGGGQTRDISQNDGFQPL